MAKIKQKVFAVFGLGIFGQTIADALTEKGAEVIAVDNDPAVVEEFKNKVTTALHIDSTDKKALEKAPLDDTDIAIVTVGDDLEASIITTVLLKQRGVPYIISRAVSDVHAEILKQIGANEVINIQENVGKSLAQRLIAPEILETIPLSSEYSFAELYVPEPFIGKKLSDIGLKEKFGLHLCMVKRIKTDIDDLGNPTREEVIVFPDKGFVFEASDILMAAGRHGDIEEFKKIL
ncbi:TrkA family potassium uptake protein [Treponema sp. OMZ 840]|uniref:potassium channel family protein n=1 Tax=Treponema sp. OMZ 840 TaxID=244313 RepID=UPI003D8DF882